MILGKSILGLSALVFITYGLVSLASPAIPSGLAGLAMTNGDAFAEIGAMYGGLQTGIGIFCLLAVLKPDLYRAGLLLLVVAIGSLAVTRLISLIMTGEDVSNYTYGALAYEFATALIAATALIRK